LLIFFLSDLNIYNIFISNLYDGCRYYSVSKCRVDMRITSSIIGEVFFQLRRWHYHYISTGSHWI